MSLLLINGSPRGKRGNSRFLLEAFAEGVESICAEWTPVTLDLAGKQRIDAIIESYRGATHILIAFPLYVDSMPSIVKALFEALPASDTADGRQLGFVVQSGFPESAQSFALERYLEKLSRRLGCRYLGTVIRGGVEASRIPPPDGGLWARIVCRVGVWTNLGGVGHMLDRRLLHREFVQLGRKWGADGQLDADATADLRRIRKVSRLGFWFYKRIGKWFYWNPMLRRNRAISRRDDRPSLPSPTDDRAFNATTEARMG